MAEHEHRRPPARRTHQVVRRRSPRCSPLDLDDPAGLVLRPARPLGLRQDDDAADGRRARGPDRGPDPHRRHRHHRHAGLPAQRQHGVPVLRALPAHDASSTTWRSASSAAATRTPRPRRRRPSTSSQLGHVGEQEADPALRWHAAARRAGPGPRQPPGRAPARRAARRPRPQAAPPDADRAQADPAGGRPDLHPRHPRPGGGHDHGRHHRGDERAAASSSSATRPRSTSSRASTFVANFLGQSNLLRARVNGRRPRAAWCAPTCTASEILVDASTVPDGPQRRVARRAPREAAPRRGRRSQPACAAS